MLVRSCGECGPNLFFRRGGQVALRHRFVDHFYRVGPQLGGTVGHMRIAGENSVLRDAVFLPGMALGSAVGTVHDQVLEAIGPQQYGGGRKGGAHLEVEQIRSASVRDPGKAFVSLDVANAFGAV